MVKNLARPGFGRICQKWQDARPARDSAEIRYISIFLTDKHILASNLHWILHYLLLNINTITDAILYNYLLN